MHNYNGISCKLLAGDLQGNVPKQSSIITAKKEQLYLETGGC